MSVSPLIMLAGIGATANVVQTGIRSLQQTFGQLFSSETNSAANAGSQQPILTGGDAAGRLQGTPTSRRLAIWARRQAVDNQLARLTEQITQLLRQADVPFESPIELEYDGNRVAVDAGDNPLSGQLEARLLNSNDLSQQLSALRRALGADTSIRLTIAPGESARLL